MRRDRSLGRRCAIKLWWIRDRSQCRFWCRLTADKWRFPTSSNGEKANNSKVCADMQGQSRITHIRSVRSSSLRAATKFSSTERMALVIGKCAQPIAGAASSTLLSTLPDPNSKGICRSICEFLLSANKSGALTLCNPRTRDCADLQNLSLVSSCQNHQRNLRSTSSQQRP
jgi:hypothetical protein